MKQIELKCEHQCGQKFTIEDMKLHQLRCESKYFKCNVDYCYSVEKKNSMLDHVITSHFKEVLIMAEFYDEFKPKMDKILENPDKEEKQE